MLPGLYAGFSLHESIQVPAKTFPYKWAMQPWILPGWREYLAKLGSNSAPSRISRTQSPHAQAYQAMLAFTRSSNPQELSTSCADLLRLQNVSTMTYEVSCVAFECEMEDRMPNEHEKQRCTNFMRQMKGLMGQGALLSAYV